MSEPQAGSHASLRGGGVGGLREDPRATHSPGRGEGALYKEGRAPPPRSDRGLVSVLLGWAIHTKNTGAGGSCSDHAETS